MKEQSGEGERDTESRRGLGSHWRNFNGSDMICQRTSKNHSGRCVENCKLPGRLFGKVLMTGCPLVAQIMCRSDRGVGVELTTPPSSLDVMGKRGVIYDICAFTDSLNSQGDGYCHLLKGRSDLEGGEQDRMESEVLLDMLASFEMYRRHPHGTIQQALECVSLGRAWKLSGIQKCGSHQHVEVWQYGRRETIQGAAE